jgi:geranylgeranyl reductase
VHPAGGGDWVWRPDRREKGVFRVLAAMQKPYDRSDERRERFVSLCHDTDVQRLTFEAYMNKKLVRARPMAHLRIGLKTIAHLTRLVPAARV